MIVRAARLPSMRRPARIAHEKTSGSRLRRNRGELSSFSIALCYKGQVQINGMPVQNTEHFFFQNGKIKGVYVFFGRP